MELDAIADVRELEDTESQKLDVRVETNLREEEVVSFFSQGYARLETVVKEKNDSRGNASRCP